MNHDGASETDAFEVLREIAHEQIERLAESYPNETTLWLSFEEIASERPGVAEDLLHGPDETLTAFDSALQQYETDARRTMALASVRIRDLPDERTLTPGLTNPTDYRDALVAMDGQITKRTGVKPKLHVGVFECSACGDEEPVEQPMFGHIREPFGSCRCDTPKQFKAWRLDQDRSEWIDHQKVRLQEPPEKALNGETANIDVHVVGDLAGSEMIACGGRVTMTGKFVAVREKNLVRHDTTMFGNGITPDETQYRDEALSEHAQIIGELRDDPDVLARLVKSFAPGHEGDEHVKLGIVLQLIGDWPREAPDGTYHRGDSHIFLIGDPGTGKTNLMDAAAECAPRASKTDGTGSSSAGLTAAIVKDDFSGDQFSIEAGTLVRANDGLAVVDELDKGNTSDLDALHTALESQEVRVDKAGRNAIMPARTALLSAANPIGGHFDPTKEFAEQTDLESPLLSRFDLIFTLKEKIDESLIREIATRMVRSKNAAGKLEKGMEVREDVLAEIEGDLTTEEFAAYIAATQQVRPVIEDEAVEQAMIDWFTETKMTLPDRYTAAIEAADDDLEYDGPPLPVTARVLDAVQRLSAAAARARWSETIELRDVELVTPLIERTLADVGIAPRDNSAFDSMGEFDAEEVGIA